MDNLKKLVGAAVNSPIVDNAASESNYSEFRLKFANNCEIAAKISKTDKERDLEFFNKNFVASIKKEDFNRKIEWLVPGAIPKQTLGIVYGRAGSGKSFSMLYLAHYLKKNKKIKRVYYLDADNSSITLEQRNIWDIIDPRSRTFNYFQTNSKRFQDTFGNELKYLERIAEHHTTNNRLFNDSLLIIDNAKELLSSNGKDITSDKDVMELMKLLKKLRDDRKMTIILLHHTKRPDGQTKKSDTGDDFKGSGSFVDAVDWIFRTKNKNDDGLNHTTLFCEFTLEKRRIAKDDFAMHINPNTLTCDIFVNNTNIKKIEQVEQKPVVVEQSKEQISEQTPVVEVQQRIGQDTSELQAAFDEATDELDKKKPTDIEQKEKELKEAIKNIFDELL